MGLAAPTEIVGKDCCAWTGATGSVRTSNSRPPPLIPALFRRLRTPTSPVRHDMLYYYISSDKGQEAGSPGRRKPIKTQHISMILRRGAQQINHIHPPRFTGRRQNLKTAASSALRRKSFHPLNITNNNRLHDMHRILRNLIGKIYP